MNNTKVRIYELAKKLDKTNKELLSVLDTLGVQVKSHMSSIDGDTAQAVESIIAGESKEAASGGMGNSDNASQPRGAERFNKKQAKSAAKQSAKSEAKQMRDNAGGAKRASGNSRSGAPVEDDMPNQSAGNSHGDSLVNSRSENENRTTGGENVVRIPEGSAVKAAAEAAGRSAAEAVKVLMAGGMMLPATTSVNDKILAVLEKAFSVKYTLIPAEKKDAAPQPKKGGKGAKHSGQQEKRQGVLTPRPPIVTVMGHVDHGKTTLLDSIRHANVTAQEAGGITQHIGAYIVMHEGKQIVFLDTPGHEAFTAMRARGANVTDVVILVVSADDGVMPQTREAIDHIKAAGVPLVVAVNKVDKPAAKPERVRQQLSDLGLMPEEWGGDVVMVDVSAKTGLGIPQLLEMVLLVAEMQELKGDAGASPEGTVIEAKLDKGKGPVATVIVRNGTLQRGDIVLFGSAWGKIRALFDWAGNPVKKAGPSIPVEILGLDDVPQPGETFTVVGSEREARDAMADRRIKGRDAGGQMNRASLEDLYSQMQEGQIPQLNLVVKCDVQGSLEALSASLEKLATNEVGVSLIHRGVGRIAESDVMLASTANAVILGFNVRPDANAKRAAEVDGVEIRTYNVIYDVIDDVKAAMGGLLKPTLREESLGEVEIREIFKIPKAGKIAGSHVMQGVVRRNAKVRIVRDGVVVWDGKIATLRHFKDEAREVKAGMDCGIAFDGYQDFEAGDVLEIYDVVEEKRSL